MGFLRIFLAVLVLASHTVLPRPLGVAAVECFFIISGFYIQAILPHYQPQRLWYVKFLASRLLRIYVPYWIILLLIIFVTKPSYIPFANYTILGIDQINLFMDKSDDLRTTWDSIIIGPAWSVAVEIMFYILAPVLLLSPRLTVTIATICLSAKAVFMAVNYTAIVQVPVYKLFDNLFPLEIGMFCLGACLYNKFGFPKSGPLDRFLAELSYPFYLLHIFVLSLFPKPGISGAKQFAATLIITLLSAIVISKIIDIPLTRLRHRSFRA